MDSQTGQKTFLKSFAIIFAAGFCALVFLLGGELSLRALGAILVVADPLEPADAALILSGGDSTRIDEAVLLYEEKFIDYAILTETGVTVSELGTDYSSLMRFTAIQKGLPAGAILITEQHVESTVDEARAALKLVHQRGFDSIIVITDPYHTLRTRLIFRRVFKNETIRVIVHPVSGHWYRSKDWWLHLAGWRITLQEYIKLFGYLIGFG